MNTLSRFYQTFILLFCELHLESNFTFTIQEKDTTTET